MVEQSNGPGKRWGDEEDERGQKADEEGLKVGGEGEGRRKKLGGGSRETSYKPRHYRYKRDYFHI